MRKHSCYRIGTGLQNLESRRLLAADAFDFEDLKDSVKPEAAEVSKVEVSTEIDLKNGLDASKIVEDLAGKIAGENVDNFGSGKLGGISDTFEISPDDLGLNKGQDNLNSEALTGAKAGTLTTEMAERQGRAQEEQADQENVGRYHGNHGSNVALHDANNAADRAAQTESKQHEDETDNASNNAEVFLYLTSDEYDEDGNPIDDGSEGDTGDEGDAGDDVDSGTEMPNPDNDRGDGNEPFGAPTGGKASGGEASPDNDPLTRNDLTRDPVGEESNSKEPAPEVGSNNGGLVTNPSPDGKDEGGVIVGALAGERAVDIVFHNYNGTYDPLPGDLI
ncbi:hypothetical protein LOC67_17695 [Stieleria sp. JC731]|uniref:hypothetical protein n=1 Tax=Pirellulaceae TaxID=2691357 RepID=UPI001E3293AF|nr:hypothetical protein [Stieleria sp. JC731]MCC9602387.1 hypothetical protein [Stieleria sp. JC731]